MSIIPKLCSGRIDGGWSSVSATASPPCPSASILRSPPERRQSCCGRTIANVVVVRIVAEPEKDRLPWHGKTSSDPTGAPPRGGFGECGAPVSDCSTHGPYVRHLNEAGAGRDEGVESCGQFREVVPPKRAALPHRCLTRRRAYPSQRIFLSGSSAPGRPRRSIDPVDHLLTGVGNRRRQMTGSS